MAKRNSSQKRTIFLSHVQEDSEQATVIKDWLEENLHHSFPVFVSSDDRCNPPGIDWRSNVLENIKRAAMSLCLVTPNSHEPKRLHFELGRLREPNRRS